MLSCPTTCEMQVSEHRRTGEGRIVKNYLYWGIAGLVALAALASAHIAALPAAAVHAHHPEFECLEAINDAGPPADPQLLFLLTRNMPPSAARMPSRQSTARPSSRSKSPRYNSRRLHNGERQSYLKLT